MVDRAPIVAAGGRRGEGRGAAPGETPRRWRRHAVAAAAVRLVIIVLPAAGGAVAGLAVARAAGDLGRAPMLVRLASGAAAAALAAVAMSRLTRMLVPLSLLLRLALVFPDRAPSRFRIALRSGNVRSLRVWVDSQLAGPAPTTVARQLETVLTLAAALNTHDRRTRGHSDRVRALTDLLAEQLRLNEEDRFRLRWAALLHDIGKLSVPAEILNKRSPLEQSEWAQLRGHPVAGRQLVEPLRSWLGDWAHAIDQHHERYDGIGYPYGLRGDDISWAGRIVSATDAFETMTAARAYKPALSVPAARRELVRCAGAHFDPRVVRAFLDVSVGRLRWTLGLSALIAPLPVIGTLLQAGARAPLVGAAVGSSPAGVLAALSLTAGLVFTPSPPPRAAASGAVLGHEPAARNAARETVPSAIHSPTRPPESTAPQVVQAPPAPTSPPAAPTPPPAAPRRLPAPPAITLPPVPAATNLPPPPAAPAPGALVQFLKHDLLG